MKMISMKLRYMILTLGMVGVLFSGCDVFEERDRSFDDDPLIEFFPTSATVSEADLDANGADATVVPVEIQLIGPQRDSNLPVSVSAVTPADTSLSASGAQVAEEGVHYRLPSTNAVISDSSSQTTISVEVLNNDMDDGGTNYLLFLDLQDSEGVEAAENLDRYTMTIRGADE